MPGVTALVGEPVGAGGHLERFLAGEPIGRMVGAGALQFDGWQQLNTEYARQFGVETPSW